MKQTSHTFAVGRRIEYDWSTKQRVDHGDVQPATSPREQMGQKDLLAAMLKSPVEACSRISERVVMVGSRHQLFEAVRLAHNMHYPLVLDPDVIWLTIAQGLANHINANTEKLRRRFVAHDGKKKIIVRRDSFLRGSPENDWPGAFEEFSAKIRESIGEHNHAMIVADFSTTGPVERAASEVVLMDAMKSYFRYGMMTCCGIPTITLDGTVEDWERVLDKVSKWEVAAPPPGVEQEAVPALDLEWWTDHLKVVLGHFVQAAKGNPDRDFWNSIYQSGGGSGVPRIGGWLTWFFPYIGSAADKKNAYVGKIADGWAGVGDDQFPSSLSKVPFEWLYHGVNYDYDFVAGLTGITQSLPDRQLRLKASDEPVPDFAIRPVAGWAIRETPSAEVTRKGSIWDDPQNDYMDE